MAKAKSSNFFEQNNHFLYTSGSVRFGKKIWSSSVWWFGKNLGSVLHYLGQQDSVKKYGGDKTVTSFYKGKLDDLMKTLYDIDPCFIHNNF